MDFDYKEFEQQLDSSGNGGKASCTSKSGFADSDTQADLQKIVSGFEGFLSDDEAGIDGAELDEMDKDNDDDDSETASEDEDREVSFDENQFANMMREMMGLPPSDASRKEGKAAVRLGGRAEDIATADSELVENEDDEEIRKLAQQMEVELNEHGALNLEHPPKDSSRLQALSIKGKEVADGGRPEQEDTDSAVDDDADGDDAVDIDYNLAKNILESFKSQAGMAGPAGNLLGLMGMSLPRDEGESDED